MKKIVDGVLVDMTQEEIDAKLAQAAEHELEEAARLAEQAELDLEVSASPLDGITFDQAVAYIETNVTDLASAKTVLKKLAKAILILNKKIGV